MSNIPTLATLLEIELLAHEIVFHLDLVGIQALAQCSRTLRSLVPPAGFVAHQRLQSILEKYFSNVDKFKTVLKTSNALIGGSTVLHLCRPREWTPGDLDIC